jgi:hypothetical protein
MFQLASKTTGLLSIAALVACGVDHHPIGDRDASRVDGGGDSDSGIRRDGGGLLSDAGELPDGARPDAGGSTDAGSLPDATFPICSAESPCLGGICTGTSCDETWRCIPSDIGCTDDAAPYCGCDGVTFRDSSTCPSRPYAHRGECEDGVDCNPTLVLCDALPPICAGTTVPEVSSGCWTGRCVEITECRCTPAAIPHCPAPYTCMGARCG